MIEEGVLIPAWLVMVVCILEIIAVIYVAVIKDRVVVGVGSMPLGMLALYYGVLAFSQSGSMLSDFILRLDIFRPALLTLLVWIAVVVLNGRLNEILTAIAGRIEKWLKTPQSK